MKFKLLDNSIGVCFSSAENKLLMLWRLLSVLAVGFIIISNPVSISYSHWQTIFYSCLGKQRRLHQRRWLRRTYSTFIVLFPGFHVSFSLPLHPSLSFFLLPRFPPLERERHISFSPPSPLLLFSLISCTFTPIRCNRICICTISFWCSPNAS